MPTKDRNINFGELYTKMTDLVIKDPSIMGSAIFDGEGNPATGEIEVDNGDVLVYFEQ